MRTSIFSIALLVSTTFSSPGAFAADEKHSGHKHETVGNIDDSKNQTIVLTERGIEPADLRMKLEDYAVFFLNRTEDALATVEIDYSGKETHCASSNLEITKDGIVRSIRPFPPRDFASVCFHDKGTYRYKVYGLKANPKGIAGSIVVE